MRNAERFDGVLEVNAAMRKVRMLLALAAMIQQQPRWAEMCARILQQCEHLQGGRDQLAGFLGVKRPELDEWLAARSGPPRAVFERAMELILAEHDRRAAREAAGVPKRRRTDRPSAQQGT